MVLRVVFYHRKSSALPVRWEVFASMNSSTEEVVVAGEIGDVQVAEDLAEDLNRVLRIAQQRSVR